MGHFAEQEKQNGAISLDHFKPSDPGIVDIEPETEPEEGQTMPPRKENWIDSAGRQILIAVVFSLLTGLAVSYVNSVRGEERAAFVQREVNMLKDQLELEKIKTQNNKEKIGLLEERIRTSDELKHLNDNFDKLFRGRK